MRSRSPMTKRSTTVEVSNPDKVFFPAEGITKGDVVEYYRRVAETMLPHLRDRPLSMHRFPDGLRGEGFFQKEAPEHFPHWVRRVTVRNAPYSLRARPGAPVATPIDWGELAGTDPQAYTIRNLFRRLAQKDDPWKGLSGSTASLPLAELEALLRA